MRYGVRSNAIAPGAADAAHAGDAGTGRGDRPARRRSFDEWAPANVSPFVAYLGTADCPITGETFVVRGGDVQRVQSWTLAEAIDQDDRWTVAELARRAGELASRLPLVEGSMHGHPEYPD